MSRITKRCPRERRQRADRHVILRQARREPEQVAQLQVLGAGQRHRVDHQDELPLAPGQYARPRLGAGHVFQAVPGRLDLGLGRQLLGGKRKALRGLSHIDRERDLAAFLQGQIGLL